jgi:hypothetical protein
MQSEKAMLRNECTSQLTPSVTDRANSLGHVPTTTQVNVLAAPPSKRRLYQPVVRR